MTTRMRRCAVVAAVAAMLGIAGPGFGQDAPLPIDSTATGRTSSDTPAVFTFNADSAGILTVVIRGETDDVDLTINVADQMGQLLPDGRSDQDVMGNRGAEQAAVTIPRAGSYLVRIETWSGSGSFDIAAGWLAFGAVEVAADPDGSPDTAGVLVPGSPISDTIDPSAGDGWDWFAVTAESAGAITVLTEGDGDLALEVFAEGDFGEAMERSDQDMQGNSGNESLTVRAQAGETYYFKVSPVFASSGAISYTIRAGIM